ncbi:MAG: HlyD family efflux transporter periplasmic adaptor subunit [Planctomycetota bacterium]|nr:MAG: HlyD family efflux transporter periplasmic adaptor subunit [Planctomycetota bacterium]
MPRLRLVTCLLFCAMLWPLLGSSQAEESLWHPHQHPAQIERRISGFTRAAAHLVIGSEDGGILRQLSLEVGDTVDGDEDWPVVARLDQTLAYERVAAAKASLAEHQAQLAQMAKDIARAKRESDWWRQEQQRVAELAAEGRASTRDADELSFRADASELSLASLTLRRDAATAALRRSEAQLVSEQHILSRHQLRAPRGWVVAARLLEPGSQVGPGSGVLELVRLDQLEIPLRLSEAELAAIRNGPIHLSRRDGTRIQALLHAVDPRFDPQSRKRQVFLRIPAENDKDTQANLESGQEWTLTLHLPDPNGGLRIPKAYLRQDLDQWLVRRSDGAWMQVRALRQEAEGLIISADGLAPGLALRPANGQTDTQP